MGLARSVPDEIVGSAVDGFKERSTTLGGIEVGARGEADAAGHRAGQIREDVAEKVVGHDDPVAPRVVDEIDTRRVHVVIVDLNAGELRANLSDDPSPQVAGEGQHVGLVHEGQLRTIELTRAGKGEAYTTLDAEAGVDRTLRGDLVRRAVAQHPPSPP